MRFILRFALLAVLLSSSAVSAQAVIVPSPVPSCANGDTLVWNTATTNFICTTGAAASQPLTDAVGLIKNASNGTKILAFNVAGISSATTRTWTIPDANITVPSTIASLAANTFTALQTLNGGLASTTGTFSSTLGVTGASTLAALSATTGTFSSTLTLSGSAANIALGSNYLSGDGGDEGVFVDGSGNVGIGTATPDANAKLSVLASGSFPTLTGASVAIQDANTTNEATSTGGTLTAINIRNANGAVLSMWQAPGATPNNQLALYATGGDAAFQSRTYSTGGVADILFNPSGGNVGIGTASPGSQLHTTGTVRFANFGAGTATFDASGNVSSASDERLKDIQGDFAPGLGAILGIRPILYRWNEASGLDRENVYAGFSAQNVLGYIPEAIGKNVEGFYSLNIVPVLAATVTAVQELVREVDELRAAANLPVKERVVIPLVGEERLIDSSTPTRLEEIAKDAAIKADAAMKASAEEAAAAGAVEKERVK